MHSISNLVWAAFTFRPRPLMTKQKKNKKNNLL